MVVLVTFGEIEMFIQINTFSLGGECAHIEYITQTKGGDANFRVTAKKLCVTAFNN